MGTSAAGSATPSPASDESLVSACLAGDHDAFGLLVRRYERSARAACLAILRDHHLARDAAQEAFVAVYRSLPSLRDPSSFGGWLTTIARNRAIRLARAQPRHLPLSPTLADAPDSSSDPALLHAIAALPEHERVVVMLRHFEHHDLADIAAILGRPLGTVTKQLSRAHDRLRRTLKPEDLR